MKINYIFFYNHFLTTDFFKFNIINIINLYFDLLFKFSKKNIIRKFVIVNYFLLLIIYFI